MTDRISPIISAASLLPLMQKDSLVLVDVRSGKEAKSAYLQKHLKGAVFVDLDTQLADIQPDVSNGGRHPLPSVSKFCQILASLGISPDAHVVAYDDKFGANAAARFWWMLRAIGHNKVQVLDGGLQAAEKMGFPLANGEEAQKTAAFFQAYEWLLHRAEIDELDLATSNTEYQIVDVRDAKRFAGLQEPIDLIAGHIPSAINIPFTENLDGEGCFLTPAKLREQYRSLFDEFDPEKMIVHCGSGVTACHTLLAMDYAGYPIPKLYVGSWSEWSRNHRPMITKES